MTREIAIQRLSGADPSEEELIAQCWVDAQLFWRREIRWRRVTRAVGLWLLRVSGLEPNLLREKHDAR